MDYVHWAETAVTMAIFKEIFAEHMQVKAIQVELRPFGKTSADPKEVTSTAYLRMPIIGHVKHWVVHPMEDLREMSFSQINESLEGGNWMITVTVYGQDVGADPAPSTPSSRPRRIPAQPELPPRQDDAGTLARIQERPEDHQAPALQDAAYEEEEFEAQDRRELAPIKPNYNLRRVLEKLPKLVADADNSLWHIPISDFTNLLLRAGMPTEVLALARPKKRCYRAQCAENASGCQTDLR